MRHTKLTALLLCFMCAFSSHAFYRKAARHHLPKIAKTSFLLGPVATTYALVVCGIFNGVWENKNGHNTGPINLNAVGTVGFGGTGAYALWGLARIAGLGRIRAPGPKLAELERRFAFVDKQAAACRLALVRRRLLSKEVKNNVGTVNSSPNAVLIFDELRRLRHELRPVQGEFEIRNEQERHTCTVLRDRIDKLDEELEEEIKEVD